MVTGLVACTSATPEDTPENASGTAGTHEPGATTSGTGATDPAASRRARRAPPPMLPNLRSLPAEDVQIRPADEGGRELRFAAALANVGTGPLIAVPGDGPGCPTGQRRTSQVIAVDANRNGTYDRGTDPGGKRVEAGCMLDHPTHDHWHFDASASYVLTRPGDAEPIAATDKVSFCLRDSRRLAGERWAGATETYGDCDRDSTQGISVGYADVYDVETDGQSLPLADDLPDGVYCLTLTADPNGLLRETREDDNAAVAAVRITGTQAADAPSTACAPAS
ncbi:lysyl oxidase [Haloactinopolyspora alba]|uniref:Lysyl oxidase n=2 Tax=Haloactinopolyspora alba TaxID=648780 RepID=A0A2P8E8P4_9ACTN|nr:lysyl oxidase [Haloactinopolyspora alba]